MVLAEMAEKAVAEMGRLWQEVAAKKLLPPIAADRRLAMEMAPRIIFGGGWCRRKRYACAGCKCKMQTSGGARAAAAENEE